MRSSIINMWFRKLRRKLRIQIRGISQSKVYSYVLALENHNGVPPGLIKEEQSKPKYCNLKQIKKRPVKIIMK